MKATTELLRKINPNFLQDGRVSYLSFRPAPNDQGLLLVYDRCLISPDDAYAHKTGRVESKSSGVLAVTVDECERLGLTTRPKEGSYPEQAFIDFSAFQGHQMVMRARQLYNFAIVRGWRYRPQARP